ncbi:MAG: pyruvate ferredoxin oxidoreductase, partial [Thermoprotei archaeon]
KYGGLVEEYRCNDADIILILMGAWSGDAKECADKLREEGLRVGVLRIRFIRPLPIEEIKRVSLGRKAVIVVDRDISFGGTGILFTEVSSILQQNSVTVRGFIAGLGGRDVTAKDFAQMVKQVYTDLEVGERRSRVEWYGVKEVI